MDDVYEVSADIEACHRDAATWGQDANEFNPSRWLLMSDVSNSIFMPFGGRPFMCPAKRRVDGKLPFGLAIIAVLVGALTAEVDSTWEVIGELPARATPLNTDREAYLDLELSRV